MRIDAQDLEAKKIIRSDSFHTNERNREIERGREMSIRDEIGPFAGNRFKVNW